MHRIRSNLSDFQYVPQAMEAFVWGDKWRDQARTCRVGERMAIVYGHCFRRRHGFL